MNALDKVKGLVEELEVVLNAAKSASGDAPMKWAAHTGISPDEATAELGRAVSKTVEDGCFSSELHLIEENDSGRVIAFTGCGPRSAANAQFLIGAAHFILRNQQTLAAILPELEAMARDAGRYRWLATQVRMDPDMGGNHRYWAINLRNCSGPSLGAAIDARLANEEQSHD